MKKILILLAVLMAPAATLWADDVWSVAGEPASIFGAEWDAENQATTMQLGTDGLYWWKADDVTLGAQTVVLFKVLKNHSWSEAYPADNYSVTIETAGKYDITFTINPVSKDVNCIVEKKNGGWPANYGGVMLQGFYWDSFEDSQLSAFQQQADDLSTYFDLLWLPNTGAGATGMGYLPVYWLNHNSSFGSEAELKKLIATLNQRGTTVIMDVVLNHKCSKGDRGSWVDFVDEQWTHDGTTEEIGWSTADICRNDDGGYTNQVGASDEMKAQNGGWQCTGNDDTGDDFSGGRDLDHTAANVQKNCITYLNYLQQELGYSGYRLDMVKGYSPYYTQIYNEATMPEFCVGEFWDGKERITNWIAGTGFTSAAFDFPFKYQVMKAFGDGDWGALGWNGYNEGIICEDTYWQRYAVTFIDNHDTYENHGRLAKNMLGANAFMLAMPGTPCVFLKHWQRYPIAIGNMILARKACGITNQSPIVASYATDGGYVVKVQGSKGTVLCIAGYVEMDTTGFRLIADGPDFAYFVSDNVGVEGYRLGSDEDETRELTVYVAADEAPCLYAWNSARQPINGPWPGKQLADTVATADGKTFWKHTFATAPVNIVISNGSGTQTSDITGLTHDSYFTFDATNPDREANWTDVTGTYYVPEPFAVPACAKPIDGHLYCYFQGNKDYDSPRAWAWHGDQNFCGDWPGARMTRVGTDGHGRHVWLWDAGSLGDLFGTDTPGTDLLPEGILFSNNGFPQTGDFRFETGGYYDLNGLLGNVNDKKVGDVNGDKLVNVADIAVIISVITGASHDSNADVNNDGTVNVADILTVISIMQ